MLPTGYSQVTRNVLSNIFKAGVDVHNLAFQNVGFPSNLTISDRMVALYRIYYQIHPNEAYGNQGSVEFYNNEIKPDVTAFLADSFMIRWLADKITHEGKEITKRQKLHGKTLFYFPFDSKDVYDGVVPVMEQMDIRVAMSKWAQNLLKKEAKMDSHYIPHGVDPHIYRPLPKHIVDKVRSENKWEDKFIVGCVARNQSRKNIPALFKAFAEFSKDKKDVILLAHLDPVDPQGTNLHDLANKLGIKDKVIYGMRRFSLGVPEFRMSLAYNTMDIHVLSTTGEGFGLPIIESMACGIPNICTDYTTARELIGENGELVRLAKGHQYIVGQLNTDRALCDIDELVQKMNKLYDNPELRKKYSESGRKYVLDNYGWEKVCRMWLELFEFGEVSV